MEDPEHLRPDRSDQSVILVAEDDVMILNIARITLERLGYFVLTAENGEEALALSRAYPGDIDLLLTDVCMPKMTGIQLSKTIAKERPGTCILLMSGSFEEENPGFPILHKPFGTPKLSQTIQGYLPACREERKRA